MNDLQAIYNQICTDVSNELLENIDEYVDLYDNKSCVDGWFKAAELRRIADAMDEVSRRYNAAKSAA